MRKRRVIHNERSIPMRKLMLKKRMSFDGFVDRSRIG